MTRAAKKAKVADERAQLLKRSQQLEGRPRVWLKWYHTLSQRDRQLFNQALQLIDRITPSAKLDIMHLVAKKEANDVNNASTS